MSTLDPTQAALPAIIDAAGKPVHRVGNSERKLRIFLLSDVAPDNSAGGQVVLYRHLIASGDFELLHQRPATPLWRNSPFWRRIKNSRLHALANALEISVTGHSPSRQCLQQARRFAPDVVLTVAHGRGYDQARVLAQRLKVPLATIFHDWWPDLEEIPARWRRVEESRFRAIARSSAICFCVSEQMRNQLDCGENAIVLPPIPGPAPKLLNGPAAGSGAIGYFGSLYDYGPMVADLAIASLAVDHVSLEIRTTHPNWSEDQIARLTAAGVLLPFAPRPEFERWIGGLKAILCVMSFDDGLKRRMETSFPSKLVESLQFGKPVIVWGPGNCAAVQWARETQACYCITTPLIKEVLTELRAFLQDDSLLQLVCQRATQLSNTDFSPGEIHRRFHQELERVVHSYRRDVHGHPHDYSQ